jgi:RNA polymerase sigma-70 factor (ECF subfamily)
MLPAMHADDGAGGGDASTGTTNADDGAAEASDATDYALLQRHAAGDPDAFAEILHRHKDHLWAVALRTTGDVEEAADALQDAMLSAMRHAAAFRGDAKVSTWLHRIVVNACLDRLRRRTARPTVPLPPDEQVPSQRDEYTSRDTAADVSAALRALPAEQRAAIVLVDVEGYPVEEAARILDVATGTVKSRCARGRARLAGMLGQLYGGNQGGAPGVEPASAEPPTTAPREELR